MAKANLRQFDYEKVANLDAGMWRSYYNHQFFKLFWQLLQLIRTQLGFNWSITIRLALYSAWAAADYRINRGHVNHQRLTKNLIKFYRIISDHATEPFNYQKAGELELAWWDIHRSSYENNEKLEQSLAAAAAAMYNTVPSSLKSYAHYRAEAMILPQHEGDKKNFTDWDKVNDLLIKAWQALHTAVQK
jgi:hypothetical protein